MKIGWLTCKDLPEPDPDEEMSIAAFRNEGWNAQVVPWDDPPKDLETFDAFVIRSTWNYYRAPGDFLKFILQIDHHSKVWNSLSTVMWNVHKSYLNKFMAGGINVVPTQFAFQGQEADLEQMMREQKWEKVVVKPTISAGSYLTRFFDREEVNEGQAFLDQHLKDRDMMVQQFMTSVEKGEEKNLIWIDGEWTHAIKKVPRFDGDNENVSEAQEISDEERAFGEKAMSLIAEDLLYARVDLFRGEQDELLLSEIECLEPSLFFLQYPPALERMVEGIKKRL